MKGSADAYAAILCNQTYNSVCAQTDSEASGLSNNFEAKQVSSYSTLGSIWITI